MAYDKWNVAGLGYDMHVFYKIITAKSDLPEVKLLRFYLQFIDCFSYKSNRCHIYIFSTILRIAQVKQSRF